MSLAWQTCKTWQNPELDPRVRGPWQRSWTTYSMNLAAFKQLIAASLLFIIIRDNNWHSWRWTPRFRVPFLVGLRSRFGDVSIPKMWFLWFPRLPGAPHGCVCMCGCLCVCTYPLCVSVTLQGAFPHLNSQLKPTLALNACHCCSAPSCLPSRPLIW